MTENANTVDFQEADETAEQNAGQDLPEFMEG